MGFFQFLKGLLLDGKDGLLQLRADRRGLPPELREQIARKLAVVNVKRLVPISAFLFLIELLNQIIISLTNTYPSLHAVSLVAGLAMLVLTAAAVFFAYRILEGTAGKRRCQRFYRVFWGLFTLDMLVFSLLELTTRGQANNYTYLLILTAAFPLLSWGEALCFFGLDAAVILPAAALNGYTPHQLLQLPMVALFALILSRILYNAHRMNDIVLAQLEASNQKLAVQAQTDPLTGLLNRRGLQKKLQELLSQVDTPHRISLLLIDVDYFKSYNDRFGHERGDHCLEQVAQAFQRCVRRETDFAARIGGEEFLVALIDCEGPDVLQTAQRLRREVLELSLVAATEAVNHFVTVSIGIASTTTPFAFPTLYAQVDKALYLAKNAGRNCVAQGGAVYRNDVT